MAAATTRHNPPIPRRAKPGLPRSGASGSTGKVHATARQRGGLHRFVRRHSAKIRALILNFMTC